MQSVILKVETYRNGKIICYTSEGIHFSLQSTIPMQFLCNPRYRKMSPIVILMQSLCNLGYRNRNPVVLEQEAGHAFV